MTTETWIEWCEPFDAEAKHVAIMRVKPEAAISFQKRALAQSKWNFIYKSDQDALDDFICTHWAQVKEYPTP